MIDHGHVTKLSCQEKMSSARIEMIRVGRAFFKVYLASYRAIYGPMSKSSENFFCIVWTSATFRISF